MQNKNAVVKWMRQYPIMAHYMCGIAGIIDASGANTAETASKMAHSLRHRGPDNSGIWSEGEIALSHRRLAIIDIENGKQPMVSASGRYIVVFNGEIFNFEELKKGPLSQYPYATRSDTEVILAAYEKWGNSAFARFDGMFAIGIWDRKEKRLVVARDHVGIKPVYVYQSGATLAFASEIRAFKVIPGWNPTIDMAAFNAYFLLGYIPAPLSPLEKVKKVRPGHYLEWNAAGGEPREVRFIPDPPAIDRNKSEEEWIEILNSHFEKSIKGQMVADVPISILLSGGVDSSALAWVANKHSNGPLSTYTIIFKESDIESGPARDMAALIHSRHHEESVSFDEAVEGMDMAMRQVEEPTTNFSIFLYAMICKKVAADFKVALAGQGADEPWAGYRRYFAEHVHGTIGGIFPNPTPSFLLSLFGRTEQVRKGLYAIGENDKLTRFLKIHAVFNPEEWRRTRRNGGERWGDESRELLGYWSALGRDMGDFENFLYVDTMTILPELALMPNDKLAMAYGLEVRPPLLGNDYLRTVLSIPVELRYRGLFNTTEKYLHRKACAKFLPPAFANRKKLPFHFPMDRIVNGKLGTELLRIFRDPNSYCAAFFHPHELETIVNNHIAGKTMNQKKLFALWSFELWAKDVLG